MNQTVILEAVNVHKSYNHSGRVLHVLKGIDLKIEKGEIITIVGPSGAGKSTLLHILGALDNPSGGKVTIEGEDIYSLNDITRARIRNKKIGFVFQFYHLLPEFTALENVILPALIKEDQRKNKPCESKGLAFLEQVGLKERVQHKPNQLSGGEQQRVAIARALINEPKIIFCDEPTGNLDSESGDEIINLLMELNKKNNQTLVVVTHDESIARLSTRTIHMRDGRLIN
jgi:lipoprotein-releasing system ATP-binding protein